MRIINHTLLVGLLFAVGCESTPKPAESKPLSQNELKRFLAGAKDPRRYGITVQRTVAGGHVFHGSHGLHPNLIALVEFNSDDGTGFPLVPVQSRSEKNFNALIDTSAQESWIDIRTAVTQNAI
ncbi:MAG: hypothetical protein AAF492_31620, partial [Verrucomicrobiota bacterium]